MGTNKIGNIIFMFAIVVFTISLITGTIQGLNQYSWITSFIWWGLGLGLAIILIGFAETINILEDHKRYAQKQLFLVETFVKQNATIDQPHDVLKNLKGYKMKTLD